MPLPLVPALMLLSGVAPLVMEYVNARRTDKKLDEIKKAVEK